MTDKTNMKNWSNEQLKQAIRNAKMDTTNELAWQNRLTRERKAAEDELRSREV